ncbi:MAG: hypothetical protein NVS3B1_28250 [Marmoricola sp.]
MAVEPHEILFIGQGKTAVCWYRCALPAMHLGADWVGIHMTDDPQFPGLYIQTGIVKHDTREPVMTDYKVIIVQQPLGETWAKRIRSLQKIGIKVLFEVDDFLHGVHKAKGHDFARSYEKSILPKFERCMRVADGLICSTEYIAERYARFNSNTYVCRNGIDMARYRLTIPERPTVNIGWAGATGHVHQMADWINGGLLDVLVGRDKAMFVSVGQPQLAHAVQQILGESRALGIPFTLIESYPSAMCLFDIALAPAGNSRWYRGKSDLRWLEAAALGLPLVASPSIYGDIEHGVTGFHAANAREAAEIVMELVDDEDLRRRVGATAREHMRLHRDMPIMARQWLDAARDVAGEVVAA